MEQSALDFSTRRDRRDDICAGKHGGDRHSQVANRAAQPCKAIMRERIRIMVAASRRNGVTLKEMAEAMGRHPNEISGRVTELKREEIIFDSGRTRERSAVLVGQRGWVNGSEPVDSQPSTVNSDANH